MTFISNLISNLISIPVLFTLFIGDSFFDYFDFSFPASVRQQTISRFIPTCPAVSYRTFNHDIEKQNQSNDIFLSRHPSSESTDIP